MEKDFFFSILRGGLGNPAGYGASRCLMQGFGMFTVEYRMLRSRCLMYEFSCLSHAATTSWNQKIVWGVNSNHGELLKWVDRMSRRYIYDCKPGQHRIATSALVE